MSACRGRSQSDRLLRFQLWNDGRVFWQVSREDWARVRVCLWLVFLSPCSTALPSCPGVVYRFTHVCQVDCTSHWYSDVVSVSPQQAPLKMWLVDHRLNSVSRSLQHPLNRSLFFNLAVSSGLWFAHGARLAPRLGSITPSFRKVQLWKPFLWFWNIYLATCNSEITFLALECLIRQPWSRSWRPAKSPSLSSSCSWLLPAPGSFPAPRLSESPQTCRGHPSTPTPSGWTGTSS